jgi:hypothetical protein
LETVLVLPPELHANVCGPFVEVIEMVIEPSLIPLHFE